MITDQTKNTLRDFAASNGRITLLTGAGISAESGIPTFRGPEGIWIAGSKEYRPQELATYKAFSENPYEVWKWYLYRMGFCASAEPNPGHQAVVEIENALADRFTLITQNVDNLHLRAGSSQERTYQIHGNIFYVRCDSDCIREIFPLPAGISYKEKGEELSNQERDLLSCPNCGSLLRPHVLWFDETYNEDYYRFESSLNIAYETDLLITVGTSASTNLPNQISWQVFRNGGTILDINIERNPFSELADISQGGSFLQGSSSEILPDIAESLAN